MKLARVDSRAHASKSHQAPQRGVSLMNQVWTKSKWRRRFSREDFQEDLCHICKCQDFIFRLNVRDRLVGRLLKFIYTQTQDLYVLFIREFFFRKYRFDF